LAEVEIFEPVVINIADGDAIAAAFDSDGTLEAAIPVIAPVDELVLDERWDSDGRTGAIGKAHGGRDFFVSSGSDGKKGGWVAGRPEAVPRRVDLEAGSFFGSRDLEERGGACFVFAEIDPDDFEFKMIGVLQKRLRQSVGLIRGEQGFFDGDARKGSALFKVVGPQIWRGEAGGKDSLGEGGRLTGEVNSEEFELLAAGD